MFVSRLSSSLVLVTLLARLTGAVEQTQHVDVQIWPLTSSAAQSFASVAYNSSHASISSSSSPSLPAGESIVRVGYTHPVSREWSGVATAATNFGSDKQKTVLLHLDNDGALYHLGFRASDLTSSQKRDGTRNNIRAEVVPVRPAPQVHMNKPVVLNADGQVAGPPEKTFLQKYWWAIAGFLVLQMLIGGGGGGDEKKS